MSINFINFSIFPKETVLGRDTIILGTDLNFISSNIYYVSDVYSNLIKKTALDFLSPFS